MVLVHREVNAVAIDELAHFVDQRILCIEHRITPFRNGPRDDGLDPGKIFKRIYILQTQMVGGDIHDDPDVAVVEAESCTDYPAASCFQHGNLNRRIL